MNGRYEVVEARVTARLVAGVRALVPKGQVGKEFGKYLGQVYALGKTGAVSLDGQNVFIYHGGANGVLTCDFCVGARAPFAAVGDVRPIETPAGVAAMVTHWGDYGGLRAANDWMQEWARANGTKFAGQSWEVYGHWDPVPAKCRTDIFYLLDGKE
ncbi:MAG TPA: GyrI-like domain-containing protein [Gemmatimonadaceae bacterium]|jgi:effector-binding domain-containing protein